MLYGPNGEEIVSAQPAAEPEALSDMETLEMEVLALKMANDQLQAQVEGLQRELSAPSKFTDDEIENQKYSIPIAMALMLGAARWDNAAAVRPAPDRQAFIVYESGGAPLGPVSYAACDSFAKMCLTAAQRLYVRDQLKEAEGSNVVPIGNRKQRRSLEKATRKGTRTVAVTKNGKVHHVKTGPGFEERVREIERKGNEERH